MTEKINVQIYVESVKQGKTPWNIFEHFMKDLCYSNTSRLKHLNAILLIELTSNYTDIDRLKYLSSILLAEFKKIISIFENEVLEDSPKLMTGSDSNDALNKEQNEIQILEGSENDGKENLDLPNVDNFENELLEDSPASLVDSYSNDTIIKEESEIQIEEAMENGVNDNLDSQNEEAHIETENLQDCVLSMAGSNSNDTLMEESENHVGEIIENEQKEKFRITE